MPPPPPRSPARLRREILLRMLLQHPFLAGEAAEEIAALDFPEPELDRLRREILQVEVLNPGLDASGLRQHLERCGFGAALDGLLSPSFDHAGFLAREGDEDAVRQGWLHVLRMIREEVRSERATAAEALARTRPTRLGTGLWRCTGGKPRRTLRRRSFFPAERASRTLDEFLKDASRGDGSPARLDEF